MSRPAPSWSFGLRKAVVLWRVVGLVFLVSALVFVPARLVFWTTVGGALSALPDGNLPEGETMLILIELLRPIWPSLALAFLSGCCALWAWAVLWHAGLVRWFFYSGRSDVRLAEVLSRGLFGWWRWARLGLTSVGVLVLVHLTVFLGFVELEERAADLADDSHLGIYLETGIFLCLAAAVLCWMAALRGAWLLGESHRRSAVLAWLAGLWETVRQPVRSFSTLMLWLAPGLVAVVAPTILGWHYEILRGMVPGTALGVAGGLVTAFCQVGLFLSFAPVTGLVGEEHPEKSQGRVLHPPNQIDEDHGEPRCIERMAVPVPRPVRDGSRASRSGTPSGTETRTGTTDQAAIGPGESHLIGDSLYDGIRAKPKSNARAGVKPAPTNCPRS